MRRNQWKRNCKLPADTAQHHRVCGRHFVSGKPANPDDIKHIDWVPTINLPPQRNVCFTLAKGLNAIDSSITDTTTSYHNDIITKPAKSYVGGSSNEPGHSEMKNDDVCTRTNDTAEDEIIKLTSSDADAEMMEQSFYSDVCTQTDGNTEKEIRGLKQELCRAEKKNKDSLEKIIRLQNYADVATESTRFSLGSLVIDDKKCRYYTGLSSGRIFERFFDALQTDVSEFRGFPKDQLLIMVLRKMRLNEAFCSLGYIYQLSQTTISERFYATINAMYPFMKELVRFPPRNVLMKHMPLAFKKKIRR